MFTQAIRAFSMQSMRSAALSEVLMTIESTRFDESAHPAVMKLAFQNLARKYIGQVDPNMSKEHAEAHLKNASVGMFCIRKSSMGDSITLSIVKEVGAIQHYRFVYQGDANGIADVESHFRDSTDNSLEEMIYKIVSEYDAALMIANASTDLSTYRQNNDAPILILATQYSKNNEDETNVRPGGTGQVIQRHLGGALTRMHRNLIPTAEEIALFKRYITPDSLIIITGHHQSNDDVIDNMKITGTYISDSLPTESQDNPDPQQVEYTPEMYVSVLMQGASLSKGDHVHLLLYACHAARPNKDNLTLSQEFAKAFAVFGINTTIIASTQIVGRLADIDKSAGDLPGAAIVLRAAPQDIRVLKSTISENNQLICEEKTYDDVFVITPIGCGPKNEVEEFFLSIIENAGQPISPSSYADLLMYFLPHKKVQSLHDDARRERAKQIFLNLSLADKTRVLEIIKPVNKMLHVCLSAMLRTRVSSATSTIFAAASTAAETHDYRSALVPS